MENNFITLLNGKELECYQGKSFMGRSHQRIFKDENENMPLFENFVWFLLENAEKIMSDSRMFLCPIYSQVFSPFFTGMPRLGTFIEWWLYYPERSRDKEGNPIFCISGNPMTGSHGCYSVDKNGHARKVSELSFGSILKSFGKVNSLYKEVKKDCEYYEFDEVIRILSGESYELRMELVKTKIKLERTAELYNTTKVKYENVSNGLRRLIKENKKLQLNQSKDEIMRFYTQYLLLEKTFDKEYEIFVKERRKLREKLKTGLPVDEYRLKLAEVGKKQKQIHKEMGVLSEKFMKDTFGKNPNSISLKDVLKYVNKLGKFKTGVPEVGSLGH